MKKVAKATTAIKEVTKLVQAIAKFTRSLTAMVFAVSSFVLVLGLFLPL